MPEPRATIHFEHKGIGHTLADKRLAVPLNQREYTWEEEHVIELFQDLQDAEASDEQEYFLGTIVLTHGEDGQIEVADGQQRLATTTILLAAIRDHLLGSNNQGRADQIERDYLLSTDLRSEEIVPRLRLNVADNDFFQKVILSKPDSGDRSTAPAKASHRKIVRAAELARERIATIIAGHKEDRKVGRLVDWVQFIREKARVILVTVPDHINAFVMFETLNDRGLPLAQSDLLKNYLLGRAGDRMQEVQQRWASMVGALETVGGDEMTVTYLRHYYVLRNGPTRERELFSKLKSEIRNKQRTVDFSTALADSAPHYVALLNPHHEKWNAYGTVTRKHIETLLALRVEQIRPLLFAVSRHFSVEEAKLAFRLFVSWSVRFLIAGGRGGLLDRHYGLRAQEIGTGQITTTKQLAKRMGDVVPADAVFESAFADARVSNAGLARYYLRALERKVKNQSDPELLPNEDEGSVNLEHILPENPGTEWNIDPETAMAYYKKIGNMALLRAQVNVALGNGSFADKKPHLAASELVLTAEAGAEDMWGAAQIIERQKRLARLAIETWPLAI